MLAHGHHIDRDALAEVKVVPSLSARQALQPWQALILVGVSPRRTAGISLHTDIYLRPDLIASWPLLAHELVHWHQAQTLGIRRFLWQYASEFVRRLPVTSTPHQAYLDLSFEVEARRIAADADAFSPPSLYRPQ